MQPAFVEYVWLIFGEDKIPTREVETRLYELFDYRCPDDLVKSLMKMRALGYLKGEVSVEKGGWVWWVDDECRSVSIQNGV
ncbi:MAG: hypothetical protein PHX75_04200 [Candidatus Methanomethylophilaceae archaeon]|jgi:hypothetical protein|nr:hypothetical protein [Candidatus Methanomethylophilaceae archaeon]